MPVRCNQLWTNATRMPCRMHSEYLRRLYLNNELAERRFEVEGKPVTLRDIHVPLFAVSQRNSEPQHLTKSTNSEPQHLTKSKRRLHRFCPREGDR